MHGESSTKPIEILLVEDNPGDVRLTREALKDGKVRNNLHVVGNGHDAMDFLRRKGRYADVVRPDLILLELNLPKQGGREILDEIKKDPVLKSIPMVVLTTSSVEQELLKTYQQDVACFMTKPISLEKLLDVVRSVEKFWLTVVRFTPGPVEMLAGGEPRGALDEMKKAFLLGISHELRTPLTAIIGFSEILRDAQPPLPEKHRPVVNGLAANATKLGRLLLELLDVERLSQGTLVPRRRPTDMAALVQIAIQAADQKMHPIEIEARHVIALVDPALVEHIVDNLLANAAKHTPLGAPITIRVFPEDEDVEIQVDDQGPGVPDHLKKVIFEPFVRGPTAPAHSPGIGVGLTLVLQLARLHGGDAWVEDRPGGGASFRVFLPAWRKGNGAPRVLVLDSELGLDVALQDAGYDVGLCCGVGDLPVCPRCPLLEEARCPLSDRADAFVFARSLADPTSREVLHAYRDHYPERVTVVSASRGDAEQYQELLTGCLVVPSPPPADQTIALIGEALVRE